MAEPLRLATYHTTLSRDGPGLLLRDLLRGDDEQIAATLSVIVAVNPDILVLQDMDWDANGAALLLLADQLAAQGINYPHRLALRPNTGMPTGIDLDGDGRSHRARDAQGYGLFSGQGGMAVLSRHPFGEVRDFSAFLWADLPDSRIAGLVPEAAHAVLRLHTVAAWDVEVLTPDGPFHVLASHAGTPVFDGPEDRNGLRNADEIRFWQRYVDGWTPQGMPFAAERFAVIGTFNVDPDRGEGRRGDLRALLDHPRLQDVRPTNPAGGRETADWEEPTPGDLRVDYILPSTTMSVEGSGVFWPGDRPLMGVTAGQVEAASDHRLVWLDLRF